MCTKDVHQKYTEEMKSSQEINLINKLESLKTKFQVDADKFEDKKLEMELYLTKQPTPKQAKNQTKRKMAEPEYLVSHDRSV